MLKFILNFFTAVKISFVTVLFSFNGFASDILFDNSDKTSSLSFSKIAMETEMIGEDEYFDFLRVSIIEQPEFLYANSTFIEKNQSLKFTKRQRWPELSTRIINDYVIERDVSEQNSLRKRQDDSFDAAIELSQPIYSGGTINAQIRKSIADKNLSIIERENALSTLILDANRIYLNAVKSYTLYNHAFKIVKEIEPYLNKVQERVKLGISDPIELALFSIKFNSLKSKAQILKTEMNRDIGIFEYFFGKKFNSIHFPNVFVPHIEMDKNKEAYEVRASKLNFEKSKEDTKLVKGEFRPKFGINTRYTIYDLDDDDNDTDIRGGVFFSMPIFTFGRSTAKISASRAKENAMRMSIDVERKNDDVAENEVVNLVKSAFNTRDDIVNSLNDTKNQRRIIKDRLDSTNFSPESYVTSSVEEIDLLGQAIAIEMNMLHGYFTFLHQNQLLTTYFRINI